MQLIGWLTSESFFLQERIALRLTIEKISRRVFLFNCVVLELKSKQNIRRSPEICSYLYRSCILFSFERKIRNLTAVISNDNPSAFDLLEKQVIMSTQVADASLQMPFTNHMKVL